MNAIQNEDPESQNPYINEMRTIEKSPSILQMGRYFVIKSIDEENIHKVTYLKFIQISL